MPQKRYRPRANNSWHIRRRSGGMVASSRQTGACLTGTCRDDPIPPGVYWIDVPWEESLQTPGVTKPQHFALWIQAMQGLGWVHLMSTKHHEGVFQAPGFFDPMVDEPPRDWHLFHVTSPAPRWTAATGLGLPTVAPKGHDTTEEDTVQRPPPESGQSFWDRLLPDTAGGKAVVVAAGIGLGGLVLYGLFRS